MRYERTPQTGRSKKLNIAFAVVAVLAVTIMGYVKSLGNLSYAVTADSISVTRDEEYSETFNFVDITDFTLVNNLDMSNPIEDKSNKKFICGRYQNEKYGEFDIYSYEVSDLYIYVRTADGRKLIFNVGDTNTTRSVFISVAAMMEDQGYKVNFTE